MFSPSKLFLGTAVTGHKREFAYFNKNRSMQVAGLQSKWPGANSIGSPNSHFKTYPPVPVEDTFFKFEIVYHLFKISKCYWLPIVTR